MDLDSFSLDIRLGGVLFWTDDPECGIRVLLARRRSDSILGSQYRYTIPTSSAAADEDLEAAAARAAHDELGLMPCRHAFEEFWRIDEGGVSMRLYAVRLSSASKAKCNGRYCDPMWFCLPDDCRVEDGDILLADELKAFRNAIMRDRLAG